MKRSQTQEGGTPGTVSPNVLRQKPTWPVPKSLLTWSTMHEGRVVRDGVERQAGTDQGSF